MKIELCEKTNLFSLTNVDILGHGCNCLGTMGAGIALQFRLKYPEMNDEYERHCFNAGYQEDVLAGTMLLWDKSTPKIANLFTQYYLGRHAKLKYVESSFTTLLEYAALADDNTIAIPYIGAGHGGLKWGDVFDTITSVGEKSLWDGTLIIVSL